MPQATPYDAQGNVIPEEKLSEELSKGNVHFAEEARVHVRIGNKTGTVAASEVPKILARKDAAILTPSAVQTQETDAAKAEAQKPYKSLGQFIGTGIESELQGQTFGLYGAIAGQVAPDYAAELKKRQEAHPLWAAANELKGAAGATLAASLVGGPAGAEAVEAGGGAEALGTLARAITAPARTVGAIGRGAEGLTAAGLRGLGYEGTSTGGRIIAGGLQTGAAGAAEGGALGIMHEATQAGLENRELNAEKLLTAAKHGALIGGVAGGILGSGAQAGKEVLSAVSGGRGFQEVLADVAEKRAVKAVAGNYQKAYDELTNSGANPDAVNRVGRKLVDTGTPLTNVEQAVKHLDTQVERAGARMGEIAQHVDTQAPYFDMTEMVNTAKDIASKYRDVDIGDYQKIARQIEKQVEPLEKSIEQGRLYRFEEAWNWRSKLGSTIGWAKKAQDITLDAKKEFYGKADDALTRFVEQYTDDATKAAWLGAKEDYHDFRIVRDAAERLAEKRQVNRFNSPTDYGTGALGFLGALTHGVGAMGSALTGLAASQAHKVLRERGPGAIARLADTLSKVDIRMQSAVDAAVTGAPTRLSEPVRREIPIVVSEAARPFLLQQVTAPSRFEARVAELQAVTARPQLLATRMADATHDLGALHPELVTAMTQAVMRTNQFLLAKLPQPLSRRDTSLTPLQEALRIPKAEQDKWMRYADAADDPPSVVAKLETGNIDREGLEALQATRPNEWLQLRKMVVTTVAKKGEALPFTRRVLLSLAFDFAGDWSLLPQNLSTIQQSLAPGQPTPPAVGPGNASRKAPEQAQEAMQTTSQKIAVGG